MYLKYIIMGKKKQIMALIEGDVMNSKLVFTLNNIGVKADDYLIDIPHVIFKLMGIKEENRTEELYRKYYDLMQQVEHIDLRVPGEKSRFSRKIYNYLRAEASFGVHTKN